MLRRWVVAACAREWGHAVDRSDFEVLQRAVLPAFAPLLRKHPGDPKCETTELCFLLRAGWVVVRPRSGLPHVAEPTRNGPSNGALPEIYLAAAKGRNGRGSGRYAGLAERKSHFSQ